MLLGLKQWQKRAQATWMQAGEHEITGRPSITVSNSWFNQSAMSTVLRSACWNGARLSKKQWRTSSAVAWELWICQSPYREASPESSRKVIQPSRLPHQAGQVIALIKVRESLAPGSCSWGLMEGGSLDSQTWEEQLYWGMSLPHFLKHRQMASARADSSPKDLIEKTNDMMTTY